MADTYRAVYREFKTAGGGGADGHVVGLNGSINPRCVEIVLTWMEVNGKAVRGIRSPQQRQDAREGDS